MDISTPEPTSALNARAARWISLACLVGAVLVTIALLVGNHLPPGKVPRFLLQMAPDKVLHAVGYGTLAFLLYGAVRFKPRRRMPTIFWVVLATAALSAFDEITQPLTGRDRDLFDFLASSGGAIIGACLAVIAEVMLRRLLPPPADAGLRASAPPVDDGG